MTEPKYVRGFYKTGAYVAKLLDIQEDKNRALVQVVAVLKHPTQGDLHHPKIADVPYFHRRKALAEFEKAWVPLSSLKEYVSEIPEYKKSLQAALQAERLKLEKDSSDWAKASLQRLKECQDEYGF